METTYLEAEAETRQETEDARQDLERLLGEIRRERGHYLTERAVVSLLRATEQGRVVGSSYGFYDEGEDGKVYACVLGHLDISLDGLARMGNVPEWSFYNTGDCARRVGRTIENYACDIHKGSDPANNSHSRNLAAWLRQFLAS